jgi:hypothetical protein
MVKKITKENHYLCIRRETPDKNLALNKNYNILRYVNTHTLKSTINLWLRQT